MTGIKPAGYIPPVEGVSDDDLRLGDCRPKARRPRLRLL